MVLIGLIIIAVVLMALGGPGIQWKLPAAMPAAGSMPWHGQSGKNEHVGQGAWHCTVRLVYGVWHGLVLPVWRGDGI